MSRIFAVGIAALTLAACQPAAEPAAPVETAPADPAVEAAAAAGPAVPTDPVDALVQRAEICVHFGGEEPFDAGRAAQIDQALEANRCDTVVADGRALQAANPSASARLDAALEPFG